MLQDVFEPHRFQFGLKGAGPELVVGLGMLPVYRDIRVAVFEGLLDRLQALFLGLVDAAVDEESVVAAGYGGLVGGLGFGAQRLAVGLERLGAGALGRAGGGVLRLGVGGQDRGGEHGREQAGHEGAAAGDGRKLGADTDHAWRFPGSGFGVRFGWRVE